MRTQKKYPLSVILIVLFAVELDSPPLNGQTGSPDIPQQIAAPATASPLNGNSELQALVAAAKQSDAQGDFARAQSEWLIVAGHLERQFGSDSWQATNARLESETALRQSQFTETQKQIVGEIGQLESEADQGAQARQWQVVLERMQVAADKTSELFGPRSHVVARIKAQMGQIAHANGNPQQAFELYRDALLSLRETMGIDHPETEALNYSLGKLLQINGQIEMALPYLSQSVATSKRVFGDTSLLYADRLSALGVAMYETGNTDEAILHLTSAESIRRVLPDAENLPYAQTLVDLGLACLASKQYELALQHLQAANDIMKRLLGSGHAMTLYAMTQLSTALVLNGKADQAESLLREVLAAQKTGPNADPIAAARTCFKLGVLVGRKGNLDESDQLLREAIATQQQSLGVTHPETQRSLTTLATLMDKAGRTGDAVQIRTYIEQMAQQSRPDHEAIRR